ncbi:hypothetical protein J8273_1526 [Carpediemonas membranifera]|uniref:Uncharacterized protein n=1 Tax=Carpediemonas membranifera TaxID=201153 RepID=A0A8J6B680_9EUKA|nr:hypothetical protein J8273_1526 [Carpediemonas membranifera]|eukprot:KAG9396528.1 hypothetical protein J8273_1526 [Carpediemonas membranifera]
MNRDEEVRALQRQLPTSGYLSNTNESVYESPKRRFIPVVLFLLATAAHFNVIILVLFITFIAMPLFNAIVMAICLPSAAPLLAIFLLPRSPGQQRRLKMRPTRIAHWCIITIIIAQLIAGAIAGYASIAMARFGADDELVSKAQFVSLTVLACACVHIPYLFVITLAELMLRRPPASTESAYEPSLTAYSTESESDFGARRRIPPLRRVGSWNSVASTILDFGPVSARSVDTHATSTRTDGVRPIDERMQKLSSMW